MSNSKDIEYKIIIIGDSNVGKTCLVERICHGKFPSTNKVTIAVDFYWKIVSYKGRNIVLQLWDTAGMEKYRQAMPQHYYRNASAVLFVYDMTDKKSFDNIKSWIKECKAYQINENIPWILIGNKSDCINDIVITTEMAKSFAYEQKMDLYETSAKNEIETATINSLVLKLAEKLHSSQSSVLIVKNIPRPVVIRRRIQSHSSLVKEKIISNSFCSNC